MSKQRKELKFRRKNKMVQSNQNHFKVFLDLIKYAKINLLSRRY